MDIKTEVIGKEEIDAMSSEERKNLTTEILEKMQETVMLFAEALIDYGVHDEYCADEGECTCGFARVRGFATHMVELNNYIIGKTTVN
jgi:hypothetical protein